MSVAELLTALHRKSQQLNEMERHNVTDSAS